MSDTAPVQTRPGTFPVPPKPPVVLPFDTALELWASLVRQAEHIEAKCPNTGQQVATIRSAADTIEHFVQIAGAA